MEKLIRVSKIPSGIRTLTDKINFSRTKTDMEIFGTKASLISKIFGCSHGSLSRPFSHGKIAYRSCLKCGAVKQFNPETLQTFGEFYYPSATKATESF